MKFVEELSLGKGVVWRSYLVSFFNGLTFYIAVLVPFYTQWGGLTLTQVQLLQSWLMFWIFIFNAPAGALADIFGRKIIIAIGCIFNAISSIMYVLYPGFYPFLLAEFIGAVGLSFVSGAGSSLLYDSLKESGLENNFKRIFGRSIAFTQTAAVIASISGGIIASKFGIQYPMLFSSIPLIIVGLIILTVNETKPKVVKKMDDVFKTTKEGLSYLKNHTKLRQIVINDVFTYSSAYFLMWLYQPALQKLGLSIIYFGFIRAAFSLSGIMFTLDLDKLEKFFGSKEKFLVISSVLCSIVLILIAIFNNIPLIILAILILGGIGLARTMVINSMMNDLIKSEIRVTVISGTMMISTLLYTIMNPLVGYLADHSIRMAFMLIGIIPLIILFIFPIKKNKHMKYTKDLQSKSGKQISLLIFENSKHPLYTIIEVHGGYQAIKEQIAQDSADLVNFCEKNNMNYIVIDLSNDTNSVNQPINEIRYSHRVLDIETTIDFVISEYNSPIIILGSSMGGFVSLNSINYSTMVKKLILNCPAVKMHECIEINNEKTEFANWKQKGIANIFNVPMTYDFYEDALKLNALNVIPKINIPILWFHGTDDEVVPISQAREAKLLNPKINLIEVIGGRHRFGDKMEQGEWEDAVEKFILAS
jgi:MFS family permease